MPPAALRTWADRRDLGIVLSDRDGRVLWRNRIASLVPPARATAAREEAFDPSRVAEVLRCLGASGREIDVVLGKLSAGDKMLVVAAKLGISHHTASDHLSDLFRRLGVHSFPELEAKLRDLVAA